MSKSFNDFDFMVNEFYVKVFDMGEYGPSSRRITYHISAPYMTFITDFEKYLQGIKSSLHNMIIHDFYERKNLYNKKLPLNMPMIGYTTIINGNTGRYGSIRYLAAHIVHAIEEYNSNYIPKDGEVFDVVRSNLDDRTHAMRITKWGVPTPEVEEIIEDDPKTPHVTYTRFEEFNNSSVIEERVFMMPGYVKTMFKRDYMHFHDICRERECLIGMDHIAKTAIVTAPWFSLLKNQTQYELIRTVMDFARLSKCDVHDIRFTKLCDVTNKSYFCAPKDALCLLVTFDESMSEATQFCYYVLYTGILAARRNITSKDQLHDAILMKTEVGDYELTPIFDKNDICERLSNELHATNLDDDEDTEFAGFFAHFNQLDGVDVVDWRVEDKCNE